MIAVKRFNFVLVLAFQQNLANCICFYCDYTHYGNNMNVAQSLYPATSFWMFWLYIGEVVSTIVMYVLEKSDNDEHI